jgi:hypothetical protein
MKKDFVEASDYLAERFTGDDLVIALETLSTQDHFMHKEGDKDPQFSIAELNQMHNP